MKMKLFNWLIIIGISLYTFTTIPHYLEINRIDQALMRLVVLPIMLLPKILRKPLKISYVIENLYLIFIIFSYFGGSVLGLYHTIDSYDKVMHFISGFLTAILGLLLLLGFKKYNCSNKKDIWYNIVVMISITLTVACFWEFFEFASDKTFNGDTQNVITSGVDDTMIDMILAFGGCLIFCFYYYFKNKSLKVENLIKFN